MELTQAALDKMIEEKSAKIVEEKIASAEHKAKLQAIMSDVYLESEQTRENRGHKAEPAINKFSNMIFWYAKARGNIELMAKYQAEDSPHDTETKGYIQKTLQAGVPSSGGFGIPQILSSRVIEALYAQTLLDKIGATRIPMGNGNIDLAKMSTSSSVGWVGEAPTAGETTPVFGNVHLSSKKLFAIAEITNSLLRYNAVSIEGWLSKDLQRKFAIALDSALLYGPGTVYTPLGMANIANIQTIGSSSTVLDQLQPDIMISYLKAKNIPMTNPHWMISPQMEAWLKNLKTTTGAWIFRNEMIQFGTLAGYPYHVSTTVQYVSTGTPYTDIWLVDADEIIWGTGLDMELRMTQDGSFVNGSGATIASFGRDSTLVRIIGEHDFNVMHPEGVVYGTYKQS